ncbi:macrophage migration inhibitory factor, putative [Eimeria acervulina]|uniref:L-dopachrome isomerase n=1 Tax=Eimeria acervulina TaxID=5801 RepID=A1XBB5_EIMAC|nr:macrophage migration inhibitory factor, putative [Eimeria acervulina]ABC73372.1 macrophage migration inhibitory factor [Eimeria acervulina]CDI84483.1 macrophage migration inhibitory factor, putative [Eimeria acervulina]
MPLCQIVCNVDFDKATANAFLSDVEKGLSKLLGKPVQYINVSLTRGEMRHGGSNEPAASVCVNSIGNITTETNNKICVELVTFCQNHLKIPVDRVFFCFSDMDAANVGIGSRVFA